MRARDLPNIISALRVVAVAPTVWALLEERFTLALVLFTLAGASDGLDGFLAKRFDWRSRLGAILDPLADKLLMAASYIALGLLGRLPLWLVVAVLLRDLVIVSGAVLYHLRVERVEISPTPVSKLNTLAQIGLIVLVLLHAAAVLGIDPELLRASIYLVFATTVVSGVQYVWMWGQRAVRTGAGEGPP